MTSEDLRVLAYCVNDMMSYGTTIKKSLRSAAGQIERLKAENQIMKSSLEIMREIIDHESKWTKESYEIIVKDTLYTIAQKEIL